MKPLEFKEKTKEELETLLIEKRTRIDELRFLLHQKKVKDVKEIARVKKDVARILTQIKIVTYA